MQWKTISEELQVRRHSCSLGPRASWPLGRVESSLKVASAARPDYFGMSPSGLGPSNLGSHARLAEQRSSAALPLRLHSNADRAILDISAACVSSSGQAEAAPFWWAGKHADQGGRDGGAAAAAGQQSRGHPDGGAPAPAAELPLPLEQVSIIGGEAASLLFLTLALALPSWPAFSSSLQG